VVGSQDAGVVFEGLFVQGDGVVEPAGVLVGVGAGVGAGANLGKLAVGPAE